MVIVVTRFVTKQPAKTSQLSSCFFFVNLVDALVGFNFTWTHDCSQRFCFRYNPGPDFNLDKFLQALCYFGSISILFHEKWIAKNPNRRQ